MNLEQNYSSDQKMLLIFKYSKVYIILLYFRQVNDMPDCCLPQNCFSCATGATIPVSSPGFAPGAVALSPVATTPGYLPGKNPFVRDFVSINGQYFWSF